MLEYFTLPQRFLFFEVRGLAPLGERLSEKFELLLHLDRMPALPGKLPKDAVKLHCVPVVNLFSCTADPLRHAAAEKVAQGLTTVEEVLTVLPPQDP